MFSKAFILAILASCALAQTSTGSAADPSTSLPAGITPCILGCIAPAAQAVGCDMTDTKCVCASTDFQQKAAQCLQQQCTADELQAALALQAEECGSSGASPSGSQSAPASASATGSATTEVSASSASVPASVSHASSVSPASSARPTSTAPVNGSSGAASTTGSAPAQTSNAAMGRGDKVGVVGLVVAGLFGLAL